MKQDGRNSFICYRSFYEAISHLSKDNKADIWDAICEYSLNQKEVDLPIECKPIFILIKPLLEANNKRFTNGKKAKRKQTVSKQEAKGKQTRSNGDEENKQTVSKPEANKDKDKDKDVDQYKEVFNSFRVRYGGSKEGLETEFKTFRKHKDWVECLPLLMPALEKEIKWRQAEAASPDGFVPKWKNLKTWLNNRCWETEREPQLPILPTVPKNHIDTRDGFYY